MAGKFCGYNGCRHVVRDGEIRCYQHKGLVEDHSGEGGPLTFSDLRSRATRFRAATRNRGFMARLVNPPSTFGNAGVEFNRDNAYWDIFVDPETVHAIYDAADSVGPRASKSELSETIARGGVLQFIENLEQILPGRVSRVDLLGLSMEGGGRRIDAPDYRYIVACVDYGEDSEIIVDPFARALIPDDAPKSQGKTPVPDSAAIVDSGSPLRDDIFIGTIDDYTSKDFSWQHLRVTRGNSVLMER